MLTYELKRGANGEVTIDIKMVFKNAEDAIKAVVEIEKFETAIGVDAELLVLMKDEKFIQAVKLYKEHSGLGLKEAKEYCDKLRDKYRAMGLVPKE